MIRRMVFCLAAVAALAGAPLAHAQDVGLLSDSYVKKLDPKALPAYQQGVQAFDRVNYESALERFQEAMKLDPNHIKLRFLVARIAYERGKMGQGEDSVRLFSVAEDTLNTLLSRKDLKPEDLRRAEEELAQVKRDAGSVAVRDARREATGRTIIEALTKESVESPPLTPLGIPGEGSSEAGTATGGGGASGRVYKAGYAPAENTPGGPRGTVSSAVRPAPFSGSGGTVESTHQAARRGEGAGGRRGRSRRPGSA